jgi:prepilin peptidase dependent protein B
LKTNRPPRARRAAAPGQRGVSLIEMMVGTAVGLFIVAGGISLYVSNLTNSRRMLVETAVNQELRAAADLVSRDLRRAGYWGNAIQGTVAIGTSSLTTANPYNAVTDSATEVTYQFSRDADAAPLTDLNTQAANEQFGFRLSDESVEMQTSNGTWVAITRPDVVRVTTFTVTSTATGINLGTLCSPQKAIGSPRYPTTTVRSYNIQLVGQSASDANVQRRLDSTVRLRNDQLSGDCVTP